MVHAGNYVCLFVCVVSLPVDKAPRISAHSGGRVCALNNKDNEGCDRVFVTLVIHGASGLSAFNTVTNTTLTSCLPLG